MSTQGPVAISAAVAPITSPSLQHGQWWPSLNLVVTSVKVSRTGCVLLEACSICDANLGVSRVESHTSTLSCNVPYPTIIPTIPTSNLFGQCHLYPSNRVGTVVLTCRGNSLFPEETAKNLGRGRHW
jgi:hypothetical protein